MTDAGLSLPETGQSRALQLWPRLFDACTADGEPTERDVVDAEELMGLVQDEYARLEKLGVPQWPETMSTWATFHELAVRVISRRHGGNGRHAKDTQLRVSDGRPLAACVGTLTWDRVQLPHGISYTSDYYGCGAIFEDTRRTSGRMWATTCPACRQKRSERRRARVRAHRRFASG